MQNALKFILFAILLSACTEDIKIDVDDSESVPVIYGEITSESNQQRITISRSAPYFSNEQTQYISGAKVTITASNGEVWNLIDTLYRNGNAVPTNGVYYTQNAVAGIVGETYNLRAEFDFDNDGENEIYTATAKMGNEQIIDSLNFEGMTFLGSQYYNATIYTKSPADKQYFVFWLRVYNKDSALRDVTEKCYTTNELWQGENIKGLVIYNFSAIENYEDDDEDDHRDVTYADLGDSIVLYFGQVEKGYYNFISQCDNQQHGEIPIFGGPPSNITTNISNGAVGYFGTFSGKSISNKIPENLISK